MGNKNINFNLSDITKVCNYSGEVESVVEFGEGHINGEEALDMLAEKKADLCIVDIRLPGINGKEFVRIAHRKALSRYYLMHTGSLDDAENDLEDCGVTDADIFFKPADTNVLLGRIKELIG